MKIAETPPVVCSACYGQYPQRRHVDFDSAWDGPVFNQEIDTGDGGKRDKIENSIDELVLCENCLADAAKLLGFGGPRALERIEELEGRVEHAEEQARRDQQENQRLREVVAKREEVPA